jgi:hypothetical protein
MWLLLRTCSLSLFVAYTGAVAQSGADTTSAALTKVQPLSAPPVPGAVMSEEQIRAKGAEWHAECMRDWDRQTHMTKQEWARTCQRVVDDRVQFLRGRGKQ